MPLFQAAGAVGSALIGSAATNNAVNATGAASQQALQEQARQFNTGQANQQPWLTTGGSALARLGQIYGLDTYTQPGPGTPQAAQAAQNAQTQATLSSGGTPYPNQSSRGKTPLQDIRAAQALGRPITDAQWAQAGLPPGGGAAASPAGTAAGGAPGASPGGGTFTPGSAQPTLDPNATFYQSPDYQFRLDQGQKSLEARAATGVFGGLDSGALRKAEIQYGGNLASGEFNQYANRLQALAGVGQTTATNEAGQGQSYGNQVANIAQNQGNNLASSYLSNGQNTSQAIDSVAGSLSKYFGNNSGSGYAAYNSNTGNYATGPQGFNPSEFA